MKMNRGVSVTCNLLVLLVAFCLFLCPVESWGQDADEIYTVVDHQAMPVMGQKALNELLKKFAKKHDTKTGPQLVYFVVNNDGSVDEIRPDLPWDQLQSKLFYDEHKLISPLKFNAATVNGIPVRAWQTLTIPFSGKAKSWYSSSKQTAKGTLDVKGNSDLSKESAKPNSKMSKSQLEKKVFDVLESQPVFPGGVAYLMQYLSQNVH